MPELTRLTHLKYELHPELIVQECLDTSDPIEELCQSAMALVVFGKRELATLLLELAPRYGLEVPFFEMETRF